MGKKVYLIRHGQTEFNKKRIIQGSGIDSSLNEFGESQAAAFYQSYKGISFDAVYTSILKRSIQSVKGFTNSGIKHEKFVGLNEINWGTHEGRKATKDDYAYYMEITNAWKDGNYNVAIEEGETPLELQTKQINAWQAISSRKDEKEILICMHGRAMRIFLCYLLDRPLSDMDKFEHHNLGLYLLEEIGGKLKLIKRNDISHLKHLG